MQCAHALQYFSRVPARIHAIFGVSYDTFPIDDESRPGHAETQLSVDFALAPDAIAPADLAFEVRQQPDRQAMLVAEICVGETFVPAHAEHGTVAASEFLIQIAEFDGLGGAARRVVLGVEVQHHQVPAQSVEQVEQFQIGIRQFEQRSGLSCTEHEHLPSLGKQPESGHPETPGFYQRRSPHCKKSRRRIAQICAHCTRQSAGADRCPRRAKDKIHFGFKHLKKNLQKGSDADISGLHLA